MKKIICLLLSITVIVSLCGCGSENTESINFNQEITIVKLPSPPKCKTTNDVSVVNEVVDILRKIEKTPTDKDQINGGWSIMVKLNVDGEEFNYTIGGVFTDSDGKQYYANNHQEIEEELLEIYNEIDVPEVNYP